jgi:formylglycine-generating enzyme required for sulfatase activity
LVSRIAEAGVWTRFLIVLCLMAPAPWPGAAVLSGGGGNGGLQIAGVLPKNSAEQFELTFWNSIKDSKQAGDYEAYLQAYPKGRFAVLARARIDQLRKAAPQGQAGGQGQTAQSQAGGPAPKAAPAEQKAREPAPPRASAKQQAGKGKAQVAQAEAETAPVNTAPSGAIAAVKDCPACPVMLALYPGPFTMGSNSSDPSERPAHKVSLKAPYALGKYEVTVEQWNGCVEANVCPSIPSAANAAGNLPMRDVSWDEVQLYLKWLGSVSGKPYRLPTEAEWEYAARGGTTARYWWGDQMKGGNSSCKGCGEPWNADAPPPAGSFVANPFGFFDMNGSVWEWVADCWHSSYKGAPADGSVWNGGGCSSRVIRGGSWKEDASYMLSTTRFRYDATVRQSQNGFRVARSIR